MSAKLAARWVIDNPDVVGSCVTPEMLSELLALVESGRVTTTLGRKILAHMIAGEGGCEEVMAKRGLRSVSGQELEDLVTDVIESHPSQVAEYRGGSVKVLGWLVGRVMTKSGGMADAKEARRILTLRLG